MAKVTCIMMQRDEELVFENWIKHYGYLFGLERLIVIDNGSDNRVVLDTLDRYERCGVRVLRGPRSTHEFHEKGNIICRIIRELEDSGDDSDFYFPLDCDEFLAIYTENGLSASRRLIHDKLDQLKAVRASLRINSSLYNVPSRPGWFCPRLYDKGFVERNTILELDHGFHYPKTTHGDRVLVTDFAYLHFHNKPLAALREHARVKLTGFVNPDDPVALANFNGAGVHLKKYFSLREEDYASIYDGMIRISSGDIANHIAMLQMNGLMFAMDPEVMQAGFRLADPDRGTAYGEPGRFDDYQFTGVKSLSTPQALVGQFIRSRHTHV